MVLITLLLRSGYGIRYNLSESLPNAFYISFPVANIKIGQIVTFTLSESPITFAKKVAGVPGDLIEIRDQKVFINGAEKGIIIDKYDPIEGGVISEGYFFMLGEHIKSFDSRYADFGLIPQEQIMELLCPIF